MVDLIYSKIGSAIVGLNDLVPRSRTSTEIDRRTRKLFNERNGDLAGTYEHEEDQAPPFMPKWYPGSEYNKRIWK